MAPSPEKYCANKTFSLDFEQVFNQSQNERRQTRITFNSDWKPF